VHADDDLVRYRHYIRVQTSVGSRERRRRRHGAVVQPSTDAAAAAAAAGADAATAHRVPWSLPVSQ